MKESNKKQIIYFRESYVQSLLADITTFGLLTLMMVFNYFYLANSKVSATVFFIAFLLYVAGGAQGRESIFTSKEDLIKHLQKDD